MSVILFISGEKTFGLNTTDLYGAYLTKEILYEKMPGGTSYLIGMSYHMGKVLPLIDFGALFFKEPIRNLPKKALMFKLNDVEILLAVDDVVGIYSINELMPVPYQLVELDLLFGEQNEAI